MMNFPCITKGCEEQPQIGSAYCEAHQPGALASTKPRGEAAMKCPHCDAVGGVHRQPVKVKRGISGGKATGAILTGGLSMLGTGLSRKVDATRCECDNCGMTWLVG